MEAARGADPRQDELLISLAHVCTTLIVLRQARTHKACCSDSSTATKGPKSRHGTKAAVGARNKGTTMHRLLELLGVDDGGAGLATSEDALLETRVERRVVVGVVGCATKVETMSVDLLDTITRAHGGYLLVAGWGLQTRAHTIANKVISMRTKRDNAAEGDCCSLDGERLLLALVLLVVGHALEPEGTKGLSPLLQHGRLSDIRFDSPPPASPSRSDEEAAAGSTWLSRCCSPLSPSWPFAIRAQPLQPNALQDVIQPRSLHKARPKVRGAAAGALEPTGADSAKPLSSGPVPGAGARRGGSTVQRGV
ncbi:hypothetical protein L1887_47177 [Cichorium endivia]|nr:hypothetical protein L1887_47177 [Cichorium endivia]